MKGHWVLRTVTLAKARTDERTLGIKDCHVYQRLGRMKGHWVLRTVTLAKARPSERTLGVKDCHVIKG